MDLRSKDAVQRADFLWALRAFGAKVDFIRTIKAANLTAYFHDTAQDLYLEDFIRRVFPCLTPDDLMCMWRWISLRKAWHIVQNKMFRASKDDLHRLFGLLSSAGDDIQLQVSALRRANILTDTELQRIMQDLHSDEVL